MFVWTLNAHMALRPGEAGIGEIPNESAVLGAMQSSMGDKALLYFPAPEWRAILRTAAAQGEEN